MQFDLITIHIGEFIRLKVIELHLSMVDICRFFHCQEKEIREMYESKSISLDTLLKWDELLEHDFFSDLFTASYSSCSRGNRIINTLNNKQG